MTKSDTIDFNGLPYTAIGQGTDLHSDYEELESLAGSSSLCVSIVAVPSTENRTKLLRHYFGIFSAEMGDMKYLEFDVRKVFSSNEFNEKDLPIKGAQRLTFIANLIQSVFKSDAELINRIVLADHNPIAL